MARQGVGMGRVGGGREGVDRSVKEVGVSLREGGGGLVGGRRQLPPIIVALLL